MLNFKLSFGDDFDLIQIVNHKLYHHRINESETKTINNNADFLSFVTDPETNKIFETYSQSVNQQFMPD
jgi:hypothetical protein